MDADEISKLAFLLYPHLYSAPHEASSAESLASRIQELRKGLEPEDEFQAIVFWLGNCDYIFRIGVPALSSKAAHKIRSPDFLVFVKFQDLEVPVLIEVKSSHKLRLDWSENYRKSLLSFASRLKLPLLVAWKCGGLWTLVDHSHFKRNVKGYRLTLKTALSEDLMCVLFRNLRIQMNPRLELRMDMEILDDATKLSSGPNAVPKEFDARIVEAGFFVEGHKLKRHSRHGFWLEGYPLDSGHPNI